MISNHILVDSIEPQSNVVKHSLHTTDTIVRSKLFQSANIFALDRLYPISCLIVSLLFFVLLNIVLTMWIVVSLNFHKDGIALKQTRHAKSNTKFHIDGDLIVNNTLFTNTVEGFQSSNLNLDQTRRKTIFNKPEAFVIQYDDVGGVVLKNRNSLNATNSILLANNNIEIKTNNLLLAKTNSHQTDTKQSMQLTNGQLSISEDFIKLKAPQGGLRVPLLNSSIIQSHIYHDMRLESRTEQINVNSKNGIQIESMGGNIEVNTHGHIVLNGNVQFDSRSVQFVNMNQRYREETDSQYHSMRHRAKQSRETDFDEPIAYQVCLCSNGNLFPMDDTRKCEAGNLICSE